ncbi:MAG: M3 family oligoendopeptidase [Chloroflexota bacterium]|nr:MAG: M3 family oligoendopeptidase [Chloroflexota bacterium]
MNTANKPTSEALPHWNLSNVYTGLEEADFVGAMQDLRAGLNKLDDLLATRDIGRGGAIPADAAELAAVLADYLHQMNALLRRYYTLEVYVYSFVCTDSFNTTAKRIESELELLGVRLRRQEVLFRGWIGTIDETAGLLDAAALHSAVVKEHAFYLRETAEQSKYLMPAGEETLAAELATSGANAWARLQGVITSQVQAPFERDGQVQELPITVIQNFYHDPDESVRRQAYESELAAWVSAREPLAACLNGVKGSVVTLDARRGRQDALHRTLDQARMDRETLEAMLGAMRESFPAFRRYWQNKARRLGKEKLAWWDIQAPVGRQEQHYSYAEARSFILRQFATFSGRLVDLSKRAFDENWIDAEPRHGKVGGAFCMSVPSVKESRILCNFDGSLEQLTTIAHELGHAYHNECLAGRSPLGRRTPMTLAETASIFNQTIITDATLSQAKDSQEELAILESFLADAAQVIVDIFSRYLFETEVFRRRAEAELSANDYCEIMTRCQRETYGDGLDGNYLHPYMWAWKPHYYGPDFSFYNFPYAFGLLFGLGLYGIYQGAGRQGQQEFLAQYDSLLASTGEATPDDLARRFGIDLRQPAFWQAGLKVIEDRIDRYIAL